MVVGHEKKVGVGKVVLEPENSITKFIDAMTNFILTFQ